MKLLECIQKYIGTCASYIQLGDVKSSVEKAQELIKYFFRADNLLQNNPSIFEKLKKANAAFEANNEYLEKVREVCKDLVAINKIQAAIKILSEKNEKILKVLSVSSAYMNESTNFKKASVLCEK